MLPEGLSSAAISPAMLPAAFSDALAAPGAVRSGTPTASPFSLAREAGATSGTAATWGTAPKPLSVSATAGTRRTAYVAARAVDAPHQPLAWSGLPYPVAAGALQLDVFDRLAGDDPVHSADIEVRAGGDGTSLAELAEAIDQVPGLRAWIERGKLHIAAERSGIEFALRYVPAAASGPSAAAEQAAAGGLQGPPRSPQGLLHVLGEEDAALRSAFDQFLGETLYGQMLASMRNTVGPPAYLHGGQTEELFRRQLDRVLAQQLAQTHAHDFSEGLFRQFGAVGGRA